MDIHELRREYKKQKLDQKDLKNDPFDQFDVWFKIALKEIELDPNSMSLATVGADGIPSLRSVLLKYYDKTGFVFFTNYNSRKAQQITINPFVSAMFLWLPLERQIIIEGKAEKISKAESLKYFASRPVGSQMGAWVSNQSSIISSRSILMAKLEEIKNKFKDGKIPLPDFWGGYRIVPHRIEFWQGGESRLHDRFLYERSGDNWTINRLAP
jgi:pyridoxamine 5'-phosphate oxidase